MIVIVKLLSFIGATHRPYHFTDLSKMITATNDQYQPLLQENEEYLTADDSSSFQLHEQRRARYLTITDIEPDEQIDTTGSPAEKTPKMSLYRNAQRYRLAKEGFADFQGYTKSNNTILFCVGIFLINGPSLIQCISRLLRLLLGKIL